MIWFGKEVLSWWGRKRCKFMKWKDISRRGKASFRKRGIQFGRTLWYNLICLIPQIIRDIRMEVFEIDTLCWISAIFTFRGFGKQGYQCTGTCIRWPIIGQCSISIPLENVHKPVASWRFDGDRDEHWHEMD